MKPNQNGWFTEPIGTGTCIMASLMQTGHPETPAPSFMQLSHICAHTLAHSFLLKRHGKKLKALFCNCFYTFYISISKMEGGECSYILSSLRTCRDKEEIEGKRGIERLWKRIFIWQPITFYLLLSVGISCETKPCSNILKNKVKQKAWMKRI